MALLFLFTLFFLPSTFQVEVFTEAHLVLGFFLITLFPQWYSFLITPKGWIIPPTCPHAWGLLNWGSQPWPLSKFQWISPLPTDHSYLDGPTSLPIKHKFSISLLSSVWLLSDFPISVHGTCGKNTTVCNFSNSRAPSLSPTQISISKGNIH